MWTRWNDLDRMFHTMDLLQAKMNRVFSDYGSYDTRSRGTTEYGPKANLSDNGDHLEMTVEVPGFAKGDLNIRIQGNYLEISGTRTSGAPEGYTTRRVERGIGSFTRSFTLPVEVDSTKVEAKLTNGLLTLALPKAETAKPKRITIQ
ncbi:MAG: Hsp20/alpha crystallin family protein [Proteobacteria bacterium]|nr:Hsp20/alpha crystallin family protein [Pseudomonadota bacterium]MBU1687858.1 Hsp20/alpha crystallin family protein [Pseudomonadota bacterium]